ncbi:unnamed protein product [Linum trigynum]|uniref:NusG-like N-terminal domain-containing protein n=1 Tax=Linum trigynum TaxID=586398 RepID=A0AAV2DZF9_9ROSI
MKGLVLQWSPYYRHQNPLAPPGSFHFNRLSIPRSKRIQPTVIRATLDSGTTEEVQQQLTARDRRQLRNQRRESKSGHSWREEVEERLSKKPKKENTRKRDALSIDRLSLLGPQWWVFRVSRIRGHETAQLVARLLARNYPDFEFKVYAPSVKEKRKLKNGTYSIKQKPIFPGCVFLWCVLNKEMHDFIFEIDGVGGFVGAKVGYMARRFNIPRPVSEDDIEKLFKQAKEEQEKHDKAFEEQEQQQQAGEGKGLTKVDGSDVVKSGADSKPKRGTTRVGDPVVNGSIKKKGSKRLAAGSKVRVKSGTFAEFEGSLKKVHRKTGKATVGFTLFGKETLVELDLHEIVSETE